jgi:hypothetical protein
VRAFACPRCGQLLFFENFECLRCGTAVGYAPDERALVALDGARWRCANSGLAGCNWLVGGPGELCLSCALTRTRPADEDLATSADLAAAFVNAEAAKRRLVFQLLELGLPLDRGLAFDLLFSRDGQVTIGHLDGVITLDLAESDDAYRVKRRQELSEPYRTVLGHLRHEVGHHYWATMVGPCPDQLARWRALFGDEQVPYTDALERHYATGPAGGWEASHVSAYATAHPWEDWAETFAHYLHIRDTLQTAAAFGLLVTGPAEDPSLMAVPAIGTENTIAEILAEWLPLTYALNAVNRSMGRGDLYPFVLSPAVADKLAFVHDVVRATTHSLDDA